jgi:hypothetical protein
MLQKPRVLAAPSPLPLCCSNVYVSPFQEAKSQESSLGYPNSQASDTSQLISQASFDGIYDLS